MEKLYIVSKNMGGSEWLCLPITESNVSTSEYRLKKHRGGLPLLRRAVMTFIVEVLAIPGGGSSLYELPRSRV